MTDLPRFVIFAFWIFRVRARLYWLAMGGLFEFTATQDCYWTDPETGREHRETFYVCLPNLWRV